MVSPYFNHIECAEEQNLYHDLGNELVYLGGIEVIYFKVENAESIHLDKLFLENRFEELKKENAYVLDMWVDNPPANKMGDEFFAKFGFSQPETCKFYCGIRHFREVMKDENSRPEEGGYIYIPRWRNEDFGPDEMWRINSVKVDDDQFHALGSPIYFLIYTERAKFSHQELGENGVLDVSEVKNTMEGEIKDPFVLNDSATLDELGQDILEFDEKHPFGEP